MGAVYLPLPLCQRRILTLQRWHGSSLARQLCNEPCRASTVAHFACQSEGDEPMANNATNSAVAALSSSRPSLCEQSELQCCAPVGDHAGAAPSLIPVSERGPCAVRLWAVRRPSLGRATTVSGPCDDRLWAVRRTNTVPRSPSNRSFVPKHPFSALSPRRAALFFYFHPTEKANADDNSR